MGMRLAPTCVCRLSGPFSLAAATTVWYFCSLNPPYLTEYLPAAILYDCMIAALRGSGERYRSPICVNTDTDDGKKGSLSRWVEANERRAL